MSDLVSLTEFKNHLNMSEDYTNEDDILNVYLRSAIAEVRQLSGCEIDSPRTVTQKFQTFPTDLGISYYHYKGGLMLTKYPVVSVDEIEYFDSSNNPQKYTDYTVEYGPPTIVYSTNSWPSISTTIADAVTVSYTIGQDIDDPYNDDAAIAKQAVLLTAAYRYKNRESVVTGTIASKLPQGIDTLIGLLRHIKI